MIKIIVLFIIGIAAGAAGRDLFGGMNNLQRKAETNPNVLISTKETYNIVLRILGDTAICGVLLGMITMLALNYV